MKVVVNPEYKHLEGFLVEALSHSYKAENVYRNFRNIVEDVTVNGLHLVVKIFKKPTEFNRVVYSFLRPTKAKRSYEYSMRLLSLGVDVPVPVGYVEKNKGLFFHTGCYVCVFTPYRPITDFRHKDISEPQTAAFIDAFAAYAASFHNKGLVHNDFNIDNILYSIEDGKFKFQLIDLNRVQFQNRSLMRSAKDMSNIHFDAPMMKAILERYCKARNLDPEDFTRKVAVNTNRSKGISKIKDIVLTPLGLRRKRRD
ncbi:MAG: hypothetical protein IKX26_04705 [Bacteroidales bacterium]|nr:hypothetical protein [Bacteroidales bacterium]